MRWNLRVPAAAAVLLLVAGSSGCTGAHPFEGVARSLKAANSKEYRNVTDEETNEWDFVGAEARGNQGRERDPDRWFKRFVMSEKANSIERNLGID